MTEARRGSWVLWVPLMALGLLIGFAAWKLTQPVDTAARSALVGQPFPAIDLPPILPDRPTLDPVAGEGPRLVNVFASWCVPCRAEAPQLEVLADEGVPIDGIAVHDRPEALRTFLAQAGDPYLTIADDQQGKAQIALGSSGVPESYIVDASGVITYQHIGPIMPQDLADIRARLAAAR